jgi:23S rRNA (cytosine1962-C5)-methyltransferase
MDYELIDSGNLRRLEKFGKFILDRPDPDCLWNKTLSESEWQKADAIYLRSAIDKGYWKKKHNFPERWEINHNNLKFNLRLSPFKHTGCFPEQSWEWDFIQENTNDCFKLLNLFGYTGVASLAGLVGGAEVTHVDASRPSITWFKENQSLSGLNDRKARVILDDALKFTEREIKRGNRYDGVVMDPPSFGHGPKGETWNFKDHFPQLLNNVLKLLSDSSKFVIANAYAVSTSHITLFNLLNDVLVKERGGRVESGELMLDETASGKKISTGIFAIWRS